MNTCPVCGIKIGKNSRHCVKHKVRTKPTKSVYEYWVDRYGEEEAKRRKEDADLRRSKTMKKHWENLTEEDRAARCELVTGENNPMHGKSVFDIWVEKYGREEAEARRRKSSVIHQHNTTQLWEDPEYRQKVVSGATGKTRTEDFRENQRQNAIAQMADPKQREIRSEAMRRSWEDGVLTEAVVSNQYGSSGYYLGVFYASKLERSRMEYLDSQSVPWERYSVQKFPFRFHYEWEGKTCLYLPDLVLDLDGEIVIEEVKQTADGLSEKERAKIQCGIETCLEHGLTYRVVYRDSLRSLDIPPTSLTASESSRASSRVVATSASRPEETS